MANGNGKHDGPYRLRVSLAIIRPANNGEGSVSLPVGYLLSKEEYAELFVDGNIWPELVETVEPAESGS